MVCILKPEGGDKLMYFDKNKIRLIIPANKIPQLIRSVPKLSFRIRNTHSPLVP